MPQQLRQRISAALAFLAILAIGLIAQSCGGAPQANAAPSAAAPTANPADYMPKPPDHFDTNKGDGWQNYKEWRVGSTSYGGIVWEYSGKPKYKGQPGMEYSDPNDTTGGYYVWVPTNIGGSCPGIWCGLDTLNGTVGKAAVDGSAFALSRSGSQNVQDAAQAPAHFLVFSDGYNPLAHPYSAIKGQEMAYTLCYWYNADPGGQTTSDVCGSFRFTLK